MAFRYFRLRLLLRVLLLTVTLALLVYGFFIRGWYVTTFLLLVGAGLQIFDLGYFVQKTNRELARLLTSIRHADFTQSFNDREHNASFRDLYGAFNGLIQVFQRLVAEKEAHFHYLQTLVEHIDIGILSVKESGQVNLLNRSGRELLGIPLLYHVRSLARISPDLERAVAEAEPGESRMVRLALRGEPAQLNVRVSLLQLQGETLRIVSLQNIRSELEEQESVAWQKLIRVLTHEIMNTVTPIVSLSATIRTLVESGAIQDPGSGAVDREVLEDVQTGLQTIEKRSRGMLHFVDRYRQLTRVPQPRVEQVSVRTLFAEVARLLSADPRTQAVDFRLQTPGQNLVVEADPELIAQVLLNLVKNAVEACAEAEAPCVEVSTAWDGPPGNRLRIDVRDNGPGIPTEILDKIFVPFYSTKKEGSGIGLPLSRQIMRLHKGNLRLTATQPGHTVVSMVF